MEVDKKYCSSSFLMYRIVDDESKCFSLKYPLNMYPFPSNRQPIKDSAELETFLKTHLAEKIKGKKVGLALSGGIDSAILLKYMPKDAIAYTFKCIVPGKEVTDESGKAQDYIKHSGLNLEHKIVPIYWEDHEKSAPLLMKHKGAPIHSIEAQIYKAALQAKADGCDIFVFGETADCIYGGHSNLLAKDYTFDEFVQRWCFLLPSKVLKESELILSPIKAFEENGHINVPKFLTLFESKASYNSYVNACKLAGIEFYAPYAETIMSEPLDLERVRKGENKYIIRELFSKLYQDLTPPAKVPMPRPMNEWMEHWSGPTRPEFLPHCTDQMTGDQKWLVYALEQFLNIIDES
ncbi:asparagine synthase [Candidatus Saccharibacteria bacterium]|nr:asparagine synthase [Candidatus Saccharibacteria bacterium]